MGKKEGERVGEKEGERVGGVGAALTQSPPSSAQRSFAHAVSHTPFPNMVIEHPALQSN